MKLTPINHIHSEWHVDHFFRLKRNHVVLNCRNLEIKRLADTITIEHKYNIFASSDSEYFGRTFTLSFA